MIDVDHDQRQWPAGGGGVLDRAAAMRFQRMAIERSSRRMSFGLLRHDRRCDKNSKTGSQRHAQSNCHAILPTMTGGRAHRRRTKHRRRSSIPPLTAD